MRYIETGAEAAKPLPLAKVWGTMSRERKVTLARSGRYILRLAASLGSIGRLGISVDISAETLKAYRGHTWN